MSKALLEADALRRTLAALDCSRKSEPPAVVRIACRPGGGPAAAELRTPAPAGAVPLRAALRLIEAGELVVEREHSPYTDYVLAPGAAEDLTEDTMPEPAPLYLHGADISAGALADYLGLSRSRVVQLVHAGVLSAEKEDPANPRSTWMVRIDEALLAEFDRRGVAYVLRRSPLAEAVGDTAAAPPGWPGASGDGQGAEAMIGDGASPPEPVVPEPVVPEPVVPAGLADELEVAREGRDTRSAAERLALAHVELLRLAALARDASRRLDRARATWEEARADVEIEGCEALLEVYGAPADQRPVAGPSAKEAP